TKKHPTANSHSNPNPPATKTPTHLISSATGNPLSFSPPAKPSFSYLCPQTSISLDFSASRSISLSLSKKKPEEQGKEIGLDSESSGREREREREKGKMD
ncbi:splicing endonuclease 2, partial [Prunus dulcis]